MADDGVTLTVKELRDLRLGKLSEAITDWKAMAKKLASLNNGGEGQAKGEISAKTFAKAVHGADWAGVNAEVMGKFVTKTAGKFTKVAAEADDVLGILTRARAAFAKHKEDLEAVVDDVAKDNIYVNDNGTTTGVRPSPQAQGDADIKEPTQAQLDAAATRVKRVLFDASESDRIAARELRFIAKDKYNFSGKGANSLKGADARQGKADAEYWAKKLKDGDVKVWELDEKQLESFNRTLRDQRDNPAFTTEFATRMGADGTLQFWRDLVDPGHGGTPTGERAKLLGHIQDNLSMSLANATRQDTPAMRAWENDMIKAGPKTFRHEGITAAPFGFQVMSSLMGKGKFDKGFLDRYGNALTEFEKDKDSGIWNLPGNAATDLDPAGKGHGTDPFTGYLKALSHNPDAATATFNDPDKADYLLKDRDYQSEDEIRSGGADPAEKLASREALGDALFAGGSGMNPDDPAAEYVKHTQAHKDVLDGALERLAGEKNDMPAAIRDDMAKLLGNHGTDTHKTMGGLDGPPPLERAHLLEVTKQISRDPESYRVLNESLNGAIVQDIHDHTEVTEKSKPGDSLDRAGRTVGFLEEARTRAIGDQKAADLKEAGWGAKGMGGYLATATASTLPFVPGGAHIANGAFAVSKALVEDESLRIEGDASKDSSAVAHLQDQRLRALKDEWYETNREWAMKQSDYSSGQGAMSEINASAHDGMTDAKRYRG